MLFLQQLHATPATGRNQLTPKEKPALKSTTAAFGSRSIGHLVTPNNNTLSQGEVALGTLYLGVGVTDNWTIGTSPFVWANFSMMNILSRWAWDISSHDRMGVELGYFKSFGENQKPGGGQQFCQEHPEFKQCEGQGRPEGGYTNFKMEAWDVKLTYTRRMLEWYRASLALTYYHYIDDERPFSLRMDPQNDDMYALNLTSLHEVRLNENWFLNLEGGVWGMNYSFPYLHTGSSIGFQQKSFLVALGASTTFSPWFPKERARQFAGYDSRASYHPELQIELFF